MNFEDQHPISMQKYDTRVLLWIVLKKLVERRNLFHHFVVDKSGCIMREISEKKKEKRKKRTFDLGKAHDLFF